MERDAQCTETATTFMQRISFVSVASASSLFNSVSISLMLYCPDGLLFTAARREHRIGEFLAPVFYAFAGIVRES